jgi:carbonic anhydrase/acetyltransferase-like protein (isoleucine patch superfamily)
MNDTFSQSDEASFGPDVVLDAPAYVDPTARLFGKIKIKQHSSLWPYVVIRAEDLEVEIGRYVNVQDHAMIHIGYGTGTQIGDFCSITHKATIHGATIGENTLVGINATVMDGAVVGANCIIGGHCIVPEGQRIPDNSIAVGSPAKVIRTRNNFTANRRNALLYYWNAMAFRRGDHRGWAAPKFVTWIEDRMLEIQQEFQERYPEDAKG